MEKNGKIKTAIVLAAILAAVWIVFGQCVSFGFLRFDDHDYTFFCPFVRTGLSLDNIAAAFSSFTHAAIWMPVTYISYMFDVSFFRGTPGAFHAGNVFFHSLNALLAFALSLFAFRVAAGKRKGESLPVGAVFACAFLGLFWAIHPQRVESVAWIAGRKDLLCTFFVLAGVLAWGGWCKAKYSGEVGAMSPKRLLPLAATACCALACMSKPSAMCFPFLALAIEAVCRSRMEGPFETGTKLRRALSFAAGYLPVFAIAVATGAVAVYSQTHADGYGVRELFSASFAWRMLNAAVSTGRYLFMGVIPAGIHLDYRAVPGGFPLGTATGLLSLALFAAAFVCAWMKFPKIRFALFSFSLWLFSALVPTLGIFGSFGEHAMADRFFYLPSLSFVLLASVLLGVFPSKFESGNRPLKSGFLNGRFWIAAACAAVSTYAGVAFSVTRSYRSDLSVFSRTLECDPAHGRALAHVGEGECAEGKLDSGIEKLSKSMELRPRFDTSAKLSYALMRRGKKGDYGRIRELCADVAKNYALDKKGQALEALGTAALVDRKWEEALGCLYASILAPRRFYSAEDAKLKLAFALYNAGRKKDALKLFSALEHSTRGDISSRAVQALETIHAVGKGYVVLFW